MYDKLAQTDKPKHAQAQGQADCGMTWSRDKDCIIAPIEFYSG